MRYAQMCLLHANLAFIALQLAKHEGYKVTAMSHNLHGRHKKSAIGLVGVLGG